METVKFTEEDMEKIKKIQNDYVSFSIELGQVQIEKKLLNDRLNAIAEIETGAWEKYDAIRKSEQDMIQEFNEKYGDGVLDLESGTFQPKSEEASNN